MFFRKKIYIDGADNIGWSIDSDRQNIIINIDKNKYSLVNDWRKADVIYNIWWNNIFNTIPDLKNNPKNKKIIVTCSNFIDFSIPEFDYREIFEKVKSIADIWICPSSKQQKILDNLGLKTFLLPFGIDLNLFKPNLSLTKQEICNKLNIDYNIIKNKIIISSFQRDSLGSNLDLPKWQKNPQLLCDLLTDLPKENFLLLLAGPRRHFIINQCKKNHIPYLYYGKETSQDDLIENAIPLDKMPLLYYLTDIYLITSKSEGGPKAAMEATATKTFVLSTNVGLSPDFINENCIFSDIDNYKKYLKTLVLSENEILKNSIIKKNYETCLNLVSEDYMKQTVSKLLKMI